MEYSRELEGHPKQKFESTKKPSGLSREETPIQPNTALIC